MMVRFHHVLTVFLALAAVCISANQTLRGSRIDSDSDWITASSDHRHEKEQQQQRDQQEQQQHQHRRNQFTIPAAVSPFLIPNPASSPNVIGASFGSVSNNAGIGDTSFVNSITSQYLDFTGVTTIILAVGSTGNGGSTVTGFANSFNPGGTSPALAPIGQIGTNFDMTMASSSSIQNTNGAQSDFDTDPGQGTTSTSFTGAEIKTTNGRGNAQGNGNAIGTSESFAQPAPNAPEGTTVNAVGGVAGQSNPNNPDGGPTSTGVNEAVITVTADGPNGQLQVSIQGGNIGDAILATNVAQLQEFLAGIPEIQAFLESLRPEVMNFNDFIDMFTQQTGIDATTFVNLSTCSGRGRSRRLQTPKQKMNGVTNRNINGSKQVSSTTSSIPVTASSRAAGINTAVKLKERNMNLAMNRKMNRNKKAVSTPSGIATTASTKLSVVDAATKREEPTRQDSAVKLDELIRNGLMQANIFRRNEGGVTAASKVVGVSDDGEGKKANIFRRNEGGVTAASKVAGVADDGEGSLSTATGEKGPVDNALDIPAAVDVSAVASEPSRESRTASTSQIFQYFLDLIVETSAEGTTSTSAGTQELIGDESVAAVEEIEDEGTETAVSVNEEARCTYNAFGDEGLFVCRTLFQPVTGESSIQTVCCDPERALETDQCGCCDGSCPDSSSKDRPALDFTDFVETLEVVDFIEKFNEEAGLKQAEIVDISNACTIIANEPLCAYNSNGDLGKWVCRTIFSPTTGRPKETSSCSDPQRALVTDQCGCCNGDCPISPCRCPCDLRADGDNAGIRILVQEGTATKERCLSPSNAIKLTTRYEKFQCIDDCRDT
jgi:hypothetical protein